MYHHRMIYNKAADTGYRNIKCCSVSITNRIIIESTDEKCSLIDCRSQSMVLIVRNTLSYLNYYLYFHKT